MPALCIRYKIKRSGSLAFCLIKLVQKLSYCKTLIVRLDPTIVVRLYFSVEANAKLTDCVVAFLGGKMKKNILAVSVLIFLSLSIYSKSNQNLIYMKSESSHYNVFFEEDKWISEERITIKNLSDNAIIFKIEGIFKADYKNNFIADTYKLKGYADKDKKNRFFKIGANETKEFRIYFIGKNTGKNQKFNRLPVEKAIISECGNTIKLLESDYEVISRIEKNGYTWLEFKILNEEIIFLLKEQANPLIEFCLDGKKKIAGGIPLICSSVPLGCDYMFTLDDEQKTILHDDVLILHEI